QLIWGGKGESEREIEKQMQRGEEGNRQSGNFSLQLSPCKEGCRVSEERKQSLGGGAEKQCTGFELNYFNFKIHKQEFDTALWVIWTTQVCISQLIAQ
ncbi:UNVERIFIED_CONTAM: hypothetical protein K2H54_052500, partial [Gekko kuhli]